MGMGSISARGQTRTTTLSPLWRLAYGGSGPSGDALREYHRYVEMKDERFLRLAEEITDRYLREGFPKVTYDLWPSVCGQVISLSLALSGDKAIPAAKRERYLAFAREVADRVLVMAEGEIIEDEKPADLFSHPKDERTKALIDRYRTGGG